MLCLCCRPLSHPHGAVGWSVVYDCEISCSNSLTFWLLGLSAMYTLNTSKLGCEFCKFVSHFFQESFYILGYLYAKLIKPSCQTKPCSSELVFNRIIGEWSSKFSNYWTSRLSLGHTRSRDHRIARVVTNLGDVRLVTTTKDQS